MPFNVLALVSPLISSEIVLLVMSIPVPSEYVVSVADITFSLDMDILVPAVYVGTSALTHLLDVLSYVSTSPSDADAIVTSDNCDKAVTPEGDVAFTHLPLMASKVNTCASDALEIATSERSLRSSGIAGMSEDVMNPLSLSRSDVFVGIALVSALPLNSVFTLSDEYTVLSDATESLIISG